MEAGDAHLEQVLRELEALVADASCSQQQQQHPPGQAELEHLQQLYAWLLLTDPAGTALQATLGQGYLDSPGAELHLTSSRGSGGGLLLHISSPVRTIHLPPGTLVVVRIRPVLPELGTETSRATGQDAEVQAPSETSASIIHQFPVRQLREGHALLQGIPVSFAFAPQLYVDVGVFLPLAAWAAKGLSTGDAEGLAPIYLPVLQRLTVDVLDVLAPVRHQDWDGAMLRPPNPSLADRVACALENSAPSAAAYLHEIALPPPISCIVLSYRLPGMPSCGCVGSRDEQSPMDLHLARLMSGPHLPADRLAGILTSPTSATFHVSMTEEPVALALRPGRSAPQGPPEPKRPRRTEDGSAGTSLDAPLVELSITCACAQSTLWVARTLVRRLALLGVHMDVPSVPAAWTLSRIPEAWRWVDERDPDEPPCSIVHQGIKREST